MTPETQGVLEQKHKLWLRDETTLGLFRLLNTQREMVISLIGSQSMDYSANSEIIRAAASQLKTIDTIVKVVKDSTTFVNLANKEQKQ